MDAKRLAQLAGIKLSEQAQIEPTTEATNESVVVAELVTASKEVESAPAIDVPKVEVPANVDSELKKAVQSHLDVGNEMKAAGREQEAKYHFTTAEFISELQTIIAGGTESDIKRASLKLFSARDSIMREVPRVVSDFLIPDAIDGNRKSLRAHFDDAQKLRQGY